ELIGLERAGAVWTIPADLESSVGRLADALIAHDQERVRQSCVPAMEPAQSVLTVLAGRKVDSHKIVALARVGHQRLLKLRLQGRGGRSRAGGRGGGGQGGGAGGGGVGGRGGPGPPRLIHCSRASSSPTGARSPAASSVPVARSESDRWPCTPRPIAIGRSW